MPSPARKPHSQACIRRNAARPRNVGATLMLEKGWTSGWGHRHTLNENCIMVLVMMAAMIASLVKVATLTTASGHPDGGWLFYVI